MSKRSLNIYFFPFLLTSSFIQSECNEICLLFDHCILLYKLAMREKAKKQHKPYNRSYCFSHCFLYISFSFFFDQLRRSIVKYHDVYILFFFFSSANVPGKPSYQLAECIVFSTNLIYLAFNSYDCKKLIFVLCFCEKRDDLVLLAS